MFGTDDLAHRSSRDKYVQAIFTLEIYLLDFKIKWFENGPKMQVVCGKVGNIFESNLTWGCYLSLDFMFLGVRLHSVGFC